MEGRRRFARRGGDVAWGRRFRWLERRKKGSHSARGRRLGWLKGREGKRKRNCFFRFKISPLGNHQPIHCHVITTSPIITTYSISFTIQNGELVITTFQTHLARVIASLFWKSLKNCRCDPRGICSSNPRKLPTCFVGILISDNINFPAVKEASGRI